MSDVEQGTHTAFVCGQAGLDGVDCGVLHQGDHIGGTEYRYKTGADGLGGILFSDDGFRTALQADFQRHWNSSC